MNLFNVTDIETLNLRGKREEKMGSTISICNWTAVIINVSLKHGAPLYYGNQLPPKACVNFQPGRVWFTVEARIWTNGTNEYNDPQKFLIPAGLGLLVPPAVAAIGGAIDGFVPSQRTSGIDEQVSNSTSRDDSRAMKIVAGSGIGMVPGGIITTAGAIVNMDRTPAGWHTAKHGVYMSDGLRIDIRGGPDEEDVVIGRNNKWQNILVDTFDELKVQVVVK